MIEELNTPHILESEYSGRTVEVQPEDFRYLYAHRDEAEARGRAAYAQLAAGVDITALNGNDREQSSISADTHPGNAVDSIQAYFAHVAESLATVQEKWKHIAEEALAANPRLGLEWDKNLWVTAKREEVELQAHAMGLAFEAEARGDEETARACHAYLLNRQEAVNDLAQPQSS